MKNSVTTFLSNFFNTYKLKILKALNNLPARPNETPVSFYRKTQQVARIPLKKY